MSQIIIKNGQEDLVFGDWQTGDPEFMWFRQLITTNKSGIGIVVQCFTQSWQIRLYNSLFIPIIREAYKMIYSNSPRYQTADDAKQEVDRFLNRVSSLKALL